jgi:hypothetical protein
VVKLEKDYPWTRNYYCLQSSSISIWFTYSIFSQCQRLTRGSYLTVALESYIMRGWHGRAGSLCVSLERQYWACQSCWNRWEHHRAQPSFRQIGWPQWLRKCLS